MLGPGTNIAANLLPGPSSSLWCRHAETVHDEMGGGADWKALEGKAHYFSFKKGS